MQHVRVTSLPSKLPSRFIAQSSARATATPACWRRKCAQFAVRSLDRSPGWLTSRISDNGYNVETDGTCVATCAAGEYAGCESHESSLAVVLTRSPFDRGSRVPSRANWLRRSHFLSESDRHCARGHALPSRGGACHFLLSALCMDLSLYPAGARWRLRLLVSSLVICTLILSAVCHSAMGRLVSALSSRHSVV